ncbi:unannotated protein [freshwater metagenome]|uniref:Unannotated protein n=1 Tax=freshwater metagenome TaxID=449393 RepID=A0A6J7CM57_9ZZZZ
MNAEELEELAGQISSIIDRVTDLAYVALREQTAGNAEFKDIEKKLSTVRRSLVKAEGTLRTLN